MNLDEFSTVVDDRRYIKPQVALDESNAFIENLRNTQGQRTAEIAQDTYNLGTAVPSNLGGLGGPGSYFTSRYQTPQASALAADLRATAQAQALSDAMNNELAQAKQRYTNAYKAYQKRRASSGGTGVTGGTGGTTPANNGNTSLWDGEIDEVDTGEEGGKTQNDSGSESGAQKKTTPPKVEDYYKDTREIEKKKQEQSGMPDWLWNVMKIFG